jgi:hypothetical protein
MSEEFSLVTIPAASTPYAWYFTGATGLWRSIDEVVHGDPTRYSRQPNWRRIWR